MGVHAWIKYKVKGYHYEIINPVLSKESLNKSIFYALEFKAFVEKKYDSNIIII